MDDKTFDEAFNLKSRMKALNEDLDAWRKLTEYELMYMDKMSNHCRFNIILPTELFGSIQTQVSQYLGLELKKAQETMRSL